MLGSMCQKIRTVVIALWAMGLWHQTPLIGGSCYVTIPDSYPEYECTCSGEILPECGPLHLKLRIKQWHLCEGGQDQGYAHCITRNISPGEIGDCDENWNNAKVMLCLTMIVAAVPVCATACATIIGCLACVAGAGVVEGLIGCIGCDLLEGCEATNVRPIADVSMVVAAYGECPRP